MHHFRASIQIFHIVSNILSFISNRIITWKKNTVVVIEKEKGRENGLKWSRPRFDPFIIKLEFQMTFNRVFYLHEVTNSTTYLRAWAISDTSDGSTFTHLHEYRNLEYVFVEVAFVRI